MSDAVASIDSSALGTPGCSSLRVHRSAASQPFIRDDFDQFSETGSGGVFTFMTGIGGFLQEFLYGYSGLRWDSGAVRISPSLSAPLTGVVLHQVAWHGRRFTVSVGPGRTTVALDSGGSLPLSTPMGSRTVQPGQTVTVATRRPDRDPTTDAVRCQTVQATTSAPGAPALAAVDGSPATGWRPTALPARLHVSVSPDAGVVGTATITWGQQWPPAPLTGSPAPGPVVTLRPETYTLAASTDGHTWRTVATVTANSGRVTDVVHFPAVAARYLAVDISSSSGSLSSGQVPVLDELTVSR